MREIKFRGKRIDNNKWVYGDLCHRTCFELDKEVCCICNEKGDYEVYENTIGQYTGLKDKNGKEIYEGDICKYQCGESNFIAEVVFHHGMFTFPIKEEPLGRFVYIHNILEKELEVIGNIYENSELLEVNKIE